MLLTSWLGALFQRFSRPVVRTRRSSRRLNGFGTPAAVQRLEPRVLLSASAVGSEFQVNTTTADAQQTDAGQGGAVATDADGDFVVTWMSANQDGSSWGIYAQRFNSSGIPQGGEFLVNSTVANQQSDPKVAMDASGDFVITWTSYLQDGSSFGVYAQRYNADGQPQGGEFRVNTTTAGDQSQSIVAMDASGDFVITWKSSGQDGSGGGIYAQLYNAEGEQQGGEFRVNTTTANDQIQPNVAMDAMGDFVITWQSTGLEDGWGVYAQRYNAAGVAQGSQFRVNTTTVSDQLESHVAMDAEGDFLVTWASANQDGNSWGVYAQRFNKDGVAQGSELLVNTATLGNQSFATGTMDADGDFVVSWMSADGVNTDVYAQRYNASGVKIGGEFRVNSTTANTQSIATVAMDAAGDFVVAWSSYGQDGSNWGVYAQRYDESTDTAGPIVAQVLSGPTLISPNDALASAVSSLTVVFSEDLNVAGGSSGTNSATNPANWQLTRNGTDISSQISGITFGYNATTNKYEAVLTLSSPLTSGAIELTTRQTIQDLAGNALDGDFNGTPGGDFTRSFSIGVVAPAGGETQVNTYTTGDQRINWNAQGGGIATDADGDYVVTWASAGQDGSGYGVYAQRYNAAGVAQGGEFQVNTTTANHQMFPTVAMDAAGDFVVTWSSYGQDGSANGVYAQRYNSAGVAQGGEFRVNTTTANDQYLPTVAMDAAGDFVVTWMSVNQDGSGAGVYAQRYNAAGVAQGGEFQVNTTTANEQTNPTVAMDAAGDFVITWMSFNQDGSVWGVYGQRYNAAGLAQGGEFRVNTTTTNDQYVPTVAMDVSGDFVVTWSSGGQDGSGWGVYAQRYNAAGVAQGGEFQVNTTTAYDQIFSTVSMDSAGDFIVTWSSFNQDGSDFGVYGQRYDVTGAAQGGEFRVNSTTVNAQMLSTVAMDAAGDFVVGWMSQGQDGSGWGVYAQRYDESTDTAGPIVAQVLDGDRLITAGDQLVSNVTSLTVVFSEDLNVTGGASGANSVTNPANWNLTRNGVDISSNISGITFGFNPATNRYEAVLSFTTPLADGVIQLTAKQSIQDLAGNALDGDQNGTPGGDFTRSFSIANVVPVGGEFQVNTTTAGQQRTNFSGEGGAIAMDANGDFVVVWASDGQDGSSYGIYAQRYNAAGLAIGSEFRVNSTTADIQILPTVAMDAAGDFVISWFSNNQDGSGSGIYAQRYDSAGVALGAEFRVNATIAGDQRYATVAMDAAGDFVITWTSENQDGSGDGIYAQRFDAAGTAQGGEFRVNTTTVGGQIYSTVAMDAAGDFVVSWQSIGQDGDGGGIYAQRYNAAGVAQGGEFRVNTTTASTQFSPTVAMDSAGNFVVTWSSDNLVGSGTDIYGQRYNSSGVAQGSEFQVNTTTANMQYNSTVAMDATGGYVVAWSSNNQDGSAGGIYAQRYNPAGVAVGGEFLVNTTTAGDQECASVAMNGAGDFAVTWNSNGQDGSSYGVYAQRYTTNISPVLAAAGNLNYTENDPATAIDTGITVSDADNATLTSATITITNFAAGQDVLAFTNDGLTMGNIAVSTNAAGVLTLTSAGGSATTAEWQAALRAVTYSNTSDNPNTTARSVAFVVNDGLSSSNTLTSTINITATNDAPVLATAGNITYTENDPATAIDTGITVSDLDNATLSSATITITNFVAGQDVLAFTNDGLTMGNIAVSTNAAGALTLTSSGGSATTAEWQAALRAVTYANTSDNPNTTARSVAFVVNDGLSSSNTLTSTINITATNDAPVVANIETAALPYAPNGPAVAVTSTFTLSDADSPNLTGATVTITGYQVGDVLQFTNTPNITGVFVGGTLTLTGADSVANYETALRSITYASTSQSPAARTISFQVTDGTDASNIQSRTVGGYAQLVGTTLNVYGTPQLDTISVGEGATLDVVVNGVVTQFTPAQVSSIFIFGFAGDDTIQVNSLNVGTSLTAFGMTGNDTLRVNAGITQGVTLNGGNDNDLLIGGSGNDTLIGGQGNDWLNGGDGNDNLQGGVGNDVYAFSDTATNQTDTVTELSGEGVDALNFTAMTTGVTVNLTSDTATATMLHRIVKVAAAGQSANLENVFGGSADDVITGNALANVIYGNGGNDSLTGGAGSDQLDGGSGNDLLKGGDQADILIGGIGDDYLKGEAGNDILNGGDGFNTLAGGANDDTYLFQAATVNQVDTVLELADDGTDTLNFAALTMAVVANLTSDTALATMDHRIVQAGAGQSANIENVLGGSGNDQITGNAANNLLSGNGGNDTISGGAGNDILVGGDGNDTLKGISGLNILIGGTGADLLLGGTGEDLMMSGSTVYDTNPALLQYLAAEWTSGNPYQTRVDHLVGTTPGGANLGVTLNSTTAHTDPDADYLTGGAGRDWFLAGSLQDALTDQAVDEVFTHIDTWL